MPMKSAMNVVKRRVTQIAENHSDGHLLAKAILRPLSEAYGVLVHYRLRRYERGSIQIRRLPCPVISVGNLTVGGTGKTPTTVFLARQLRAMGYAIVVISRGYKGRLEKKGGIVSDGNAVLLGPVQAGDEPYLMARLLPGIPVIIGADRYAAGCLAVDRFKPQVIVLDDGFQHIRLHRDVNLLLLDAAYPLGNGFLLPRGSLREPPEACSRADVIIYTRWAEPELAKTQVSLPIQCRQLPVFHCRHRSILRFWIPKGKPCQTASSASDLFQDDPAWLQSPLFVFSGLARNTSFHESLVQMGGHIAGSMGFSDHHRYSRADLAAIHQKAAASSSRYLITTDKDFMRLPQEWRFGLDLIVLGVEIDFGEEQKGWDRFWRQRFKALIPRKASALPAKPGMDMKRA